jgi:hypothetical protein
LRTSLAVAPSWCACTAFKVASLSDMVGICRLPCALYSGAFGLVLLLYDDRRRTCVPMTTTPNGILKIGNRWWRYPLQCPGYGFRQLLLTRNTGSAPEVASGRSRLPSRCPMQPCSDPRRRVLLSHLEHASGRLDLRPRAPPGDECARERRVREGIVNLTRSSRPSCPLFLERGSPIGVPRTSLHRTAAPPTAGGYHPCLS